MILQSHALLLVIIQVHYSYHKNNMNEIFANIGYVLLIINLILLIKGFSGNGKAFKIYAIYTFFMFIIQLLTNILYYRHMNNWFLSHFYFILQFILLSLFYIEILISGYQKKIVKIGMILGLAALIIQYSIDWTIFNIFNLFEIFITSFLLIIYATFHFYNMLNEQKRFYFINMGIFIYLFGSTVLFLAGNLVAKLSKENNTITWVLNALLYVVYQLFILYELKQTVLKKPKYNENYPGN